MLSEDGVSGIGVLRDPVAAGAQLEEQREAPHV